MWHRLARFPVGFEVGAVFGSANVASDGVQYIGARFKVQFAKITATHK